MSTAGRKLPAFSVYVDECIWLRMKRQLLRAKSKQKCFPVMFSLLILP